MKIIIAFNLILFSFCFANAQNIDEKIADSLYNSQKYKEAIFFYKKTLDKKINSEKILAKISDCYLKIQQLDSAYVYLDKSIKLFPNNSYLYYLLSEYYINQQQLDNAIDNINKAISITPDSGNYYLRKGYIYFLKEDYSSALKTLKISLTTINTKQQETLDLIIKTYFYQNQLDSSLYYTEIAISKFNAPQFHQYKAQIKYYQQKYTDAFIAIEEGLNLFPNNLILIRTLLSFYNSLGQYADIIKTYSRYKVEDDEDIYYYLIIAYYNLNLDDSVMHYLKVAKKLFPNNENFYWIEGYISFNKHNFYNAYLNFSAANKLNPEKIEYYIYLCSAKNLYNTDTSILDKNLRFKNFNLKKTLKDLQKNKSYAQNLINKFQTAPLSLGLDEYFKIYIYQTLSTDYSGYLKVYRPISNAYDKKDYETCIKLGIDFINQYPYYPYIYLIVANSYYSLKQYDKALHYLTIYYGFLNSILATGYGENENNAYIVAFLDDEYLVLNSMGHSAAGQSLVTKKKQHFDILYYYDKENNKKSVYFNINLFYK